MTARSKAREDLDGLVINTELTLLSIIQGAALYWVINCGFPSLMAGQWEYWAYIFSGIVIILLFWTRGLIHTFTLIRWPIEFGHNFLYILCTFIESVLFTQIMDPFQWHLWSTIFWVGVVFLFWFDMKMIRDRMKEKSSEASKRLYEILEGEQKINILWVMPAVALFYAASTWAIWKYPVFFVEQNGHLYLAVVELLSLIAYQGYVLWFFKRISPMILAHREAEDVAA